MTVFCCELKSNFFFKLKARRNEEITCDEILLMLVFFRKFNSILQKGFTISYYKIMQIDSTAFNDYLFFPKVYLPNQNELKSFITYE
jgi:hypothetical protein